MDLAGGGAGRLPVEAGGIALEQWARQNDGRCYPGRRRHARRHRAEGGSDWRALELMAKVGRTEDLSEPSISCRFEVRDDPINATVATAHCHGLPWSGFASSSWNHVM